MSDGFHPHPYPCPYPPDQSPVAPPSRKAVGPFRSCSCALRHRPPHAVVCLISGVHCFNQATSQVYADRHVGAQQNVCARGGEGGGVEGWERGSHDRLAPGANLLLRGGRRARHLDARSRAPFKGGEGVVGGWVNPPCDIPSGCCFFTGPWTVTRSSLRMLRRVAAFCRPLRPVLLLVLFPRSRSPVVGVPGLCWLRQVPFVRQRCPVVGGRGG